MAEHIDLDVTAAVMREAAHAADDAAVVTRQEFIEWSRRIKLFSEQCKDANLKSYIPALGNALLAKASNPRIDVFSLKAGDNSPGAYDARRSAEKVLVPASQLHRFSLSTSGAQPLNNQPFFREYRIHKDMRVRGHAKPVLGVLLSLLHEAQQLRKDEAIVALAAFVHVRRGYLLKYAARESSVSIRTGDQLADVLYGFVGRHSEGGGRAQAAVGGLLDALYGTARVRVGKRNEPDRHMPGDVGIREAPKDTAPFTRVFEVRDKNVPPYGAEAFVAKAAAANVWRAVLIAVAAEQEPLDRSKLKARANESAVELELFTDWESLVDAIVFAADSPELLTVEAAVAAIRTRLIQLELSEETISEWDAITVRQADRSQKLDQ
jgi:hypothetical protein